MLKKINFLLLVILIISLIIELLISLQDNGTLLKKILLDDAFYGISISKNIALGNGITYNGVDTTNGFQPLWIFAIVPIFLIIKDINLAVNAILIFASVLNVLTAFIIFKFSKHLFNEKIAIVSTALYALNPLIMFQMLSGIDTAIYIFFVMLTLFYYYLIKDNLNRKNTLILGILIGLSILGRMDAVFLLASIILAILIETKNKYMRLKNFIFIAFAAALILSPWFLWSYLTFKTITQSSAIAKYSMSHGIFPFFDLKEPKTLSEIISMVTESLIRTVGSFLNQLGIVEYNITPITILLLIFILIPLIFSFKIVKKLKVNLTYAILLILFYSFYMWNVQIRYFTPVIPTVIIMISYGLYNLTRRFKRSDLILLILVVIFLFLMLFNGYRQWENGYYNWQEEMYENTIWIKENTNPSDVIGSFNSGIQLYFSERKVINLDGVLNFDAIEAIKNKSVIKYMKSRNVTYLVDIAFFNETVYNDYLKGRKIDILKENTWESVLGEGKESLVLIDQKEKVYKHLRGFNMLVVFFKAKLLN